ncbi:MPPV-079 CC chemokine-like protein [Magpiepox virus 2]|nr:MPPV-079 CC chemokine-like protein [Magpiepox virus 2]
MAVTLSHLGHPSPKPIVSVATTPPLQQVLLRERKTTECLSNCTQPELRSFGCGDEYCKTIEKLHSIRNGTAAYQYRASCCNGRYITEKELSERLISEDKACWKALKT